jgi:hypothetical protein
MLTSESVPHWGLYFDLKNIPLPPSVNYILSLPFFFLKFCAPAASPVHFCLPASAADLETDTDP